MFKPDKLTRWFLFGDDIYLVGEEGKTLMILKKELYVAMREIYETKASQATKGLSLRPSGET